MVQDEGRDARSQEFKRGEERLSRILEGSNEGLWEWPDLSKDEYWWSARFYAILGYDDNAFVPTLERFSKLLHPDDRERVLAEVRANSTQGGIVESECRLRSRSGRYVWLLARGRTFCDEAGRPVCMAGTVQDLTERKETETALRRLAEELSSHKRILDALMHSVNDHVYICDPSIRFLYVSKSAAKALGQIPNEIIGKRWCELNMPSDIMERFEQQVKAVLATGGHHREEVVYPTAQGPRHVEYVVSPLDMGEERDKLVLNVVRDITERKQAEEARQKSERFLRATLDSLSSHVAILDETGTIVTVNEAWRSFARASGVDPSLVCEGANYIRVCERAEGIDAETARAVVTGIRSVTRGEVGTFSCEYPCHSPDTERWFTMHVTRFSDYASPYVVVAHETITEQKKAERELRHRETELAHLSRIHTVGEMSATLAHELNQPLHAINNYVRGIQRRLRKRALADESTTLIEALEEVSKEVNRASAIVSHLRALVRRRVPARSSVDVAHLLRQVVELLLPMARDKDVALRLALAEELPTIETDAIELEQVVVNLVVNAVEATEGLPPERRCVTIAGRSANADEVEITVHDMGHGIPEELKDEVFEPFATTKKDGLGMGLAICRSIVDSHGGRIWAVHGDPDGASFHFTLPVHAAEKGGDL